MIIVSSYLYAKQKRLLNNLVSHHKADTLDKSKLKLLVPSVGIFFTPLELERAFMIQDERRAISSRRFVAPVINHMFRFLFILS